jgi:uncharacterized protein
MSESVLGKERIHSMDIIRGFAVLGIFLVNWPSMVGVETLLDERSYSGMDAYFRLFYDMFVQTKFYTIFSFLFGLGFYVFMTRAEQRVKHVKWLFTRRLLILFIFGFLHFVFLWYGDILHSYAIAGLFLLLFYRRKPKTILIWSIVLLVLFQLFMFLTYLAPIPASTVNEIQPYNAIQQWYQEMQFRLRYFTGENIFVNIIYLPEILGLFLLGLYAGKKNIFRCVSQLKKPIQITQITALLLTIPSWYMIITYFLGTDVYNPAAVMPFVIMSGKTLSLFYVTTLLLLAENDRFKTVFIPFQYVGRMALTNYLSQTVVTTFLFAFLFENTATLHFWQGALYCIIFYTIQIFFSKWWLANYQFGPMEYVWRVGTYGKKQQLRKTEKAS